MDNNSFTGDRLGARDFVLASLVGLLFAGLYLVFAARGLDPALWNDMTVSAGLRPPRTIFPGVWRIATSGFISLVGMGRISAMLRLCGAAAGGFSVFFAYLIVRQALAYLTRVRYVAEWGGIAATFSAIAAVCFGACDSMWRVVSPLTPGGLRLVFLLLAVHVFLRWLKRGGVWRVLLTMFLAGALSSETPFAFLLPLLFYVAYRLTIGAIDDEQFQVEGKLPPPALLPRWRMFFAFVAGFLLVAALNVWSFVSFGGLEASGWSAFDIVFHYAVGFYTIVRTAASPIGWVLGMTFSVLPFVVALVLFPMLCRDNEPIRFKLGLILFFAGILALVQCGILPYTRLWSLSSGAAEVASDFLECLFALCTAATTALAASCFAQGCQSYYEYDSDDGGYQPVERRGFLFRNLALAVVVLFAAPVLFRIYRPAETELRAVVRDALVETVRECGDAEFVFTDGRLDAGLELVAAQMGSKVRPLNMMGDSSPWERHIRTRGFEDGTPDYEAVSTGVPVLLRVWAGERTNGMDRAAVQLGFEFWRRARRPLPAQSGLVAREKGVDDAEAERGVAAAKRLADRIIFVAKNFPRLSISPALRGAVSSVSWRISRFARLRDDEALANELDEWNETVKQMMKLIEYERMRTFMQLTPYEGLGLALRRADFAEARRYAVTVLQMDPDDPEANFGTGMAYLMEDKLKEAEFYLERTLKRRPEEPAVLNNLSIIYRKTNRLEKSLEFVRRAHELAPANEEIQRTLRDTERVVKNRADVLKNAVSR